MNNWILYICLSTNLFMFGVICFVQLVHYPIFLNVRPEDWRQFHHFHSERTGWVVAVPIALQLLSTIFLDQRHALLYFFTALALLTTALISMPLQQRLSKEFSSSNIHQLILSNWIRVLGWGGASAILINELANKKGVMSF